MKTPRPDLVSTSTALANSALEPPVMSCASEPENGTRPEIVNDRSTAASRDPIEAKVVFIIRGANADDAPEESLLSPALSHKP